MPDEIDYCLHQIDRYLDTHDLPEDDIGIVLDVGILDPETTRVEANVRYMGRNRNARYDYDITFQYEGSDPDRIVNQVYPEWVDRLEEQYPQAQLEYARPDRGRPR